MLPDAAVSYFTDTQMRSDRRHCTKLANVCVCVCAMCYVCRTSASGRGPAGYPVGPAVSTCLLLAFLPINCESDNCIMGRIGCLVWHWALDWCPGACSISPSHSTVVQRPQASPLYARASVHQAVEVGTGQVGEAGKVTAVLAESNGILLLGL